MRKEERVLKKVLFGCLCNRLPDQVTGAFHVLMGWIRWFVNDDFDKTTSKAELEFSAEENILKHSNYHDRIKVFLLFLLNASLHSIAISQMGSQYPLHIRLLMMLN